MRPGVVDRLVPGGEQAVQPHQVRDAGPVADLDQELLPHHPEKTFDFTSALGPPGRAVGDLDAQPGRGPRQRRIDKRGAVIDVDRPGDAAGGQRRAQRRGQPHAVFEVAPAGGHHRPRMVIEEGEQVRLAAGHRRAVQRVAGPQLVRPGRLEPAEDRRRPPVRAGVELQPLEVPLQGARRRRPLACHPQDPGHLRGGAAGVLAFQPGGQLQYGRVGAGRDLPGRRGQRREPPGLPGPDPPVERGPRYHHVIAERPRVRAGGQLPDQPSPLPGRQRRIGGLADQLIPEQGHLLGAGRPLAVLLNSP